MGLPKSALQLSNARRLCSPWPATVHNLMEAISAAKESLEYFDDPLYLQVPYEYVEARIIKPPACIIAKLFAIPILSSCFVIPILQALSWLILLMIRRVIHSTPQVSPQYKRTCKCIPRSCVPRTYCTEIKVEESQSSQVASHTALETSSKSDNAFSFDTDGIRFIINNSATCIICNKRDLFVGRLSAE